MCDGQSRFTRFTRKGLHSKRATAILLIKNNQFIQKQDHKKWGGACAATCIEIVHNVVRAIQGVGLDIIHQKIEKSVYVIKLI